MHKRLLRFHALANIMGVRRLGTSSAPGERSASLEVETSRPVTRDRGLSLDPDSATSVRVAVSRSIETRSARGRARHYMRNRAVPKFELNREIGKLPIRKRSDDAFVGRVPEPRVMTPPTH